MGIRMIRHCLLLTVCIIILGCGDAGNQKPQPDKPTSELNEAMVFSEDFAQLFDLDMKKAVSLDPGLMAVRLYWTRLANPLLGDTQEPALQAQFYIKQDVPVHLSGVEGTFNSHESAVPSGFLYFQHRPKYQGEEVVERENNTFLNRVIAVSEPNGSKTHNIHRYKRPLTPGVQVIEIGAVFREPFHIYFYIGDETPSTRTIDPHFNRVSHDVDDYDPEKFIRFELPKALHPMLVEPYVLGQPNH